MSDIWIGFIPVGRREWDSICAISTSSLVSNSISSVQFADFWKDLETRLNSSCIFSVFEHSLLLSAGVSRSARHPAGVLFFPHSFFFFWYDWFRGEHRSYLGNHKYETDDLFLGLIYFIDAFPIRQSAWHSQRTLCPLAVKTSRGNKDIRQRAKLQTQRLGECRNKNDYRVRKVDCCLSQSL